MRNVLLTIALMAAAAWGGQDPFAIDSCGVIVKIHEKYGPVFYDTGTVVSVWNGCITITKKDGTTALYPMANYAVSKTIKQECNK